MTTEKYRRPSIMAALTGVLTFAVALFFAGSAAFAQTVYTNSNGAQYQVPAGYAVYNNSGVYYDSATAQYYDAMTGQYSAAAPSGAATMNANGTYVLPAGYAIGSGYGTYYSPTTGMYYDPASGFYSTVAPAGPIYPATSVVSSSNPGLPNTGAGGNASETVALLALTGALALGGIALFSRKASQIVTG